MSLVERLEQEAAAFADKASGAREKLTKAQAKAAAEREARTCVFDEHFVRSYDREHLDAELDEAYQRLSAELAEQSWIQGAVDVAVAGMRRVTHAQEVNNALIRLGRSESVFEPNAREVQIPSAIAEVVSRLAGERAADERQALYEAREHGEAVE